MNTREFYNTLQDDRLIVLIPLGAGHSLTPSSLDSVPAVSDTAFDEVFKRLGDESIANSTSSSTLNGTTMFSAGNNQVTSGLFSDSDEQKWSGQDPATDSASDAGNYFSADQTVQVGTAINLTHSSSTGDELYQQSVDERNKGESESGPSGGSDNLYFNDQVDAADGGKAHTTSDAVTTLSGLLNLYAYKNTAHNEEDEYDSAILKHSDEVTSDPSNTAWTTDSEGQMTLSSRAGGQTIEDLLQGTGANFQRSLTSGAFLANFSLTSEFDTTSSPLTSKVKTDMTVSDGATFSTINAGRQEGNTNLTLEGSERDLGSFSYDVTDKDEENNGIDATAIRHDVASGSYGTGVPIPFVPLASAATGRWEQTSFVDDYKRAIVGSADESYSNSGTLFVDSFDNLQGKLFLPGPNAPFNPGGTTYGSPYDTVMSMADFAVDVANPSDVAGGIPGMSQVAGLRFGVEDVGFHASGIVLPEASYPGLTQVTPSASGGEITPPLGTQQFLPVVSLVAHPTTPPGSEVSTEDSNHDLLIAVSAKVDDAGESQAHAPTVRPTEFWGVEPNAFVVGAGGALTSAADPANASVARGENGSAEPDEESTPEAPSLADAVSSVATAAGQIINQTMIGRVAIFAAAAAQGVAGSLTSEVAAADSETDTPSDDQFATALKVIHDGVISNYNPHEWYFTAERRIVSLEATTGEKLPAEVKKAFLASILSEQDSAILAAVQNAKAADPAEVNVEKFFNSSFQSVRRSLLFEMAAEGTVQFSKDRTAAVLYAIIGDSVVRVTLWREPYDTSSGDAPRAAYNAIVYPDFSVASMSVVGGMSIPAIIANGTMGPDGVQGYVKRLRDDGSEAAENAALQLRKFEEHETWVKTSQAATMGVIALNFIGVAGMIRGGLGAIVLATRASSALGAAGYTAAGTWTLARGIDEGHRLFKEVATGEPTRSWTSQGLQDFLATTSYRITATQADWIVAGSDLLLMGALNAPSGGGGAVMSPSAVTAGGAFRFSLVPARVVVSIAVTPRAIAGYDAAVRAGASGAILTFMSTGGGVPPGGTPSSPGAPSSGLDNAKRLSPDELATGRRLEAKLGRPLQESEHVGEEFVDQFGKTYDALGTPKASQFWNEPQFLKQIDKHLLKSNDFTVIDLTGFSAQHIEVVRKYVDGLSAGLQDKIIRIGF